MSNKTDRSFIRAYNPSAENETMKPKVTPWTVQSTGAVASTPRATSQVVIAPSQAEQAVSVTETHFSLPEQVAEANRAAARVIPKTSPQISGHPATVSATVSATGHVTPSPAAKPFVHQSIPESQAIPEPHSIPERQSIPASQSIPNTYSRPEPYSTPEPQRTGTRHFRVETGNSSAPPTPHFLRMQRESTARQTNQFAVALEENTAAQPTKTIRPQWEVDQFRWPVVCDVLRDTSSHRLDDVVESMLTQAKLGNKVVAVTSFDRKEGRSTIAMSLARLAAQAQVDVALIDGDLDEPSIANYLGISFDTSWNHIEPKLPLGEAAIVSIKDQFVVFPAGHDTAFPERTVRNNAGPLLATLSDSFDIVFIDIGPIFTAAHRWLMPEAGSLIRNALVVRDVRRTSVEQVDDACCRLVKSGVQNMAIIDNFLGVDG